MKFFRKLLPESMHHLICIESDQYLPPTKCRILSVLPHVAVPQPSEQIFRVDFGDCNDIHVKWLGTLPNKCECLNWTASALPYIYVIFVLSPFS